MEGYAFREEELCHCCRVGFQCWQRFNPSAEQSQRSDQTTHVLVLQGSFALTLCLHSHFVKMVFNSEQMDVWLKT